MKKAKTKERRKWSKIEKAIFVICCLIIVVGNLFILYLSRYDIVKMFYEDYKPVAMNLSEEEKLEDFEYYYNTMVTSFPMLEEYKTEMGYNFENKKEHYEKLIKATTSDYEFFCVMSAIVNEFPSFHTDIVFPRFNEYETLGCYNMTATLCNNKVYPASVYWDELLEKEYDKEDMRGTVYVGYTYIDGEYISLIDLENVDKGTKLVEVNGKNVHDYVFENQFSSVKKNYDPRQDKVYVEAFYINNKFGEPVTLTLQDTLGNIYYQKAFCEQDKRAGLSLYMAYHDNTTEPGVLNNIVYNHVDGSRDVGYIRISAFSMLWADEIAQKLNEIKECKAIIIDLRNNYGGVQMLPQEYIYPFLFSNDLSIKNKWYMMDSKSNKRIIWEDIAALFFRLKLKKDIDKDLLYSYRSYDYVGETTEEKEIYVLVNSDTGSAADGFVAALKETSATIVGENTGGEGLADSFICDYLPNSGLVFTYMFGKAYNDDGTDNSLYGTAPDIYSTIKAEGYIKRDELVNEGKDPYTYENRLVWDTVLVEALQIMENNQKSNNSIN